jgi:DNA-binding NtrC family response regulator
MAMRDDLERLVGAMVARGIQYPDAHREFEKRFIAAALGRTNGSVGRAAALLGIHRNTLSRKLSEHRLRPR